MLMFLKSERIDGQEVHSGAASPSKIIINPRTVTSISVWNTSFCINPRVPPLALSCIKPLLLSAWSNLCFGSLKTNLLSDVVPSWCHEEGAAMCLNLLDAKKWKVHSGINFQPSIHPLRARYVCFSLWAIWSHELLVLSESQYKLSSQVAIMTCMSDQVLCYATCPGKFPASHPVHAGKGSSLLWACLEIIIYGKWMN